MKDFTKLGVLGGVSLLADLMTLTPYVKKVLHYIGMSIEAAELTNHIVSWLATMGVGFSFVILIIVLFTHKKITDAGTHGIACSIAQFINFRVKNNTSSLLNAIHRDLYHCTHSIKKNIKRMRAQNPACIQSIKDVPEMKRLLQSFQTTLYYQFNIDASISIYRARETEDKQKVLIRDMFVKNNDEKQMSNGRRQDNIYLIAKEPEESMKDLTAKAEKYRDKNGRGAYHKNSAFDFILSNPHNSWLSNDLTVDVAKREFFTSSYNYGDFYKSLAAFVILPPECNDNRDDLIKGILTFDTMKTGMFLEKECVTIMGLMAHLVNEIYDSLN